MEDKKDGKGRVGIDTASEQSRQVVCDDDGVVCEADDGENQQDHNRSEPTQRCAELKHIPRHRNPQSEHSKSKLKGKSSSSSFSVFLEGLGFRGGGGGITEQGWVLGGEVPVGE